jgi:hypothetical protein
MRTAAGVQEVAVALAKPVLLLSCWYTPQLAFAVAHVVICIELLRLAVLSGLLSFCLASLSDGS